MASLLFSFFVYTFFAWAMYACARRTYRIVLASDRTRTIPRKAYQGYFWCIFLFSLIAGLRYDVGIDHLSYLETYLHVLRGNVEWRVRGIETGFMLFTQFCGMLRLHPTIYFGIIAAIQLAFFLWPYRKEYSIVPYMMFLFILGSFFLYSMNVVRQAVASCIFVFSIPFIQQRKLTYFLFFICIAFLFHRSALIFLPVYLLAYDKSVWSNRLFLFATFGACITLGITPLWMARFSSISQILQIIGYDYYFDRFDQIMDTSREFAFGPRMVFMLLQYLIVIYFYPKCRNYFPDSLIDINFKLFFMGICGYYLFINTNLLFLRPTENFTVFAIPMIGYTLAYLSRNRRLFFLLLLISAASHTYISCLSDANKRKDERRSCLYQFYFTEITNHQYAL